MESDLEGADEDLRAAWRLSEASCAVHAPDHPNTGARAGAGFKPGNGVAFGSGPVAGTGGGAKAAAAAGAEVDRSVPGPPPVDVVGTLKRLEATSMGSLAVAVFKRDLLRLTGLGGVGVVGLLFAGCRRRTLHSTIHPI